MCKATIVTEGVGLKYQFPIFDVDIHWVGKIGKTHSKHFWFFVLKTKRPNLVEGKNLSLSTFVNLYLNPWIQLLKPIWNHWDSGFKSSESADLGLHPQIEVWSCRFKHESMDLRLKLLKQTFSCHFRVRSQGVNIFFSTWISGLRPISGDSGPKPKTTDSGLNPDLGLNPHFCLSLER